MLCFYREVPHGGVICPQETPARDLSVRQTIDNIHTMLEGFGLGGSAYGRGSVGGAAPGRINGP